MKSAGSKMAARKKKWRQDDDDLSLRAYLLNIGAELCAKAASTNSQWAALTHVFKANELTQFLHIAPTAIKGKLLEMSLGL